LTQQTLNGKEDVSQKIIKTISYNQEEIIKWIIELYCPEGIELDPTYSIGNFYKNISEPMLKFDINPQLPDVKQADCSELPLEDNSVKSIMFDPPFIVGIGTKEAKKSIICERFGTYSNIQNDLWGMYYKSLKEFYRILKQDGVLIVKCQDIISCGQQFLSHVEIINRAIQIGYYPKDLFILLSNRRMNRWVGKKQQHARKFHSYFIVFIKQKNYVKYGGKCDSSQS
jgi:hypothetical protein